MVGLSESSGPTSARRRVFEPSGYFTAMVLGVAFSGFLMLPQVARGDDAVRVVMLRQLASGIKPDTKYSFIQPVVSTPVFWVLDRLHFGAFAVTLIPMLWLAMWCVAMWSVLSVERSKAFAHHAIVLAVVSLLGAYLVGFGSDVFAALGISAGVVCGLLARRLGWRIVAWTVLLITAANTPVMVAAVGVIALWLSASTRRLRYLLLPVGVFGLMVLESTLVTGSLSWTRYTRAIEQGNMQLLPWGEMSGFGWPLWSGVVAVLFSFGRGLIFFIPQLWNGPMRGSDALARADRSLWCATLALVPLYGMWWAWYGGVTFGPRFFLLAVVPAAMAGASVVCDAGLSPLRTVVCATATLASLWVAFAGAVFHVTTTAFDTCVSGGGFQNEALCLYTPEYSGLWAPLWAADPIGLRAAVFAVAIIILVAPTLFVLGSSLRPAGVRALRLARLHLGGKWSL